jgi:soluble lytic murein transglycosylase-like protein
MAYISVVINIPDIKKSYKYKQGNTVFDYSSPAYKASNIKMVQKIYKTYGQYFNYWAKVFEIPVGILVGWAATESGGQMSPPNPYNATGLMQVTPGAIFECARKWKNEVGSDLPSEVTSVINSKIPSLLNKSTTLSSVTPRLFELLEKDANFNIMSGSLCLRWLLERYSTFFTGGQLNKAMVAYNAGAYHKSLSSGGKANKTPIDSTSLSENRLVPAESRKYLLKMLGIDGFISIIFKDKVI